MTNLQLLSELNGTAHYHNDEDHHHDPTNEESYEEVLTAKAVTMLVLCSVSTIMGVTPMILAKLFKWDLSGQNPR